MSSLKYTERSLLEKILGMRTGYVSDFSDRTFREFVLEYTDIDISTDAYAEYGSSKANRLRAFWKKESDELNADLIEGLLDHAYREKTDYDREVHVRDGNLFIEARKIITRLRDGGDATRESPIRIVSSASEQKAVNPAPTKPVADLSDEELLAIIRMAENTNIPGSRYQKAKTEWEIRHQQATLAAMKSNTKPAFVNIAPGASVKGLTMKGNKMIGDGDFLRTGGVLEDAHLEDNEHITRSIPSDKKWFEKPVGIVTLAVIGAVIAGGILFYLGWQH